jgi:hypothetical protein
MSTYGPEVVFDLPSGDDRVQQLLEAADIEYGSSRHYRSGDHVEDDVTTALHEAVTQATKGHVQLDGFELHSITYETARVEITGGFGLVDDLANDFESFAKEGGSA